MRRAVRNTGPTPEQRADVIARAGGCCERCGVRPQRDHSIHHRLPRGRGGTNVLSNLVLLCGSGTTGCHGEVESYRERAYAAGWLVMTGMDPDRCLVDIHGRGMVFLTNEGAYAQAS